MARRDCGREEKHERERVERVRRRRERENDRVEKRGVRGRVSDREWRGMCESERR